MEVVADYRSEYHGGEIYAMSGGTGNHSLITQNFSRVLGNSLLEKDCVLFGSDLAVYLEAANSFSYPDVSVVCGEPTYRNESKLQLTNPFLIVEVLSKTTEAFDRGGKFQKYQTLPSLKSYVLVDQWDAIIEVFHQDAQGEWRYNAFKGTDSMVAFPNLNVELKLGDIYRRVNFEPKELLEGAE